MAQMYVEGVVATFLNDGASSSVPSLRMATPFAVPFTNSSKRVCVHVCVPSAQPNAASRATATSTSAVFLIVRLRQSAMLESHQVPGGVPGRMPSGKNQGKDAATRRAESLHRDRDHLRAGNHVIQRRARLVHRRLTGHDHLLPSA